MKYVCVDGAKLKRPLLIIPSRYPSIMRVTSLSASIFLYIYFYYNKFQITPFTTSAKKWEEIISMFLGMKQPLLITWSVCPSVKYDSLKDKNKILNTIRFNTTPTSHTEKHLLPVKSSLRPEEAIPDMEFNRSNSFDNVFIALVIKFAAR